MKYLPDAQNTIPPRWLAWGWALVVVLVAFHQVGFWRSAQIDTDIFALLPTDAHSPDAQRAMRQLAEQGERRIVVMLGGTDWDAVRQTAAAMRVALDQSRVGLQELAVDGLAAQTIDFYKPWRDRLLTLGQTSQLQMASAEELAAGALSRLHGLSAGQPTNWLVDPLGLWPSWWAERSSATAARPRDGLLWVADPDGKRDWAVLLYETRESAFRLSSERRWFNALTAARASLGPTSDRADVQMRVAGIPLFAEAGAAQGSAEMNSIGWGSLIGIVLLVWWTLRAIRPIVLIGVSLAVGCAAAVSATALVFGKIHMLTLVFGASLVGVAVDYGINYFGSRLGAPQVAPWSLMKSLAMGLVLALSTSVLGYAVMAVTPLPGLRQVALFSGVGLVAAFATVVCWFPWLDRGSLKGSPFSDFVTQGFVRWPRLEHRHRWPLLTVFVLVSAGGIVQLRSTDDVRQLQASPPELIQQQLEVGRLLMLASPTQFFVVHGTDAQEVLRREEMLKQALISRAVKGPTSDDAVGLLAVSDWVPSEATQQVNRQLTSNLEERVLHQVSQVLGEHLQRPDFSVKPLTMTEWLDSPVSTLMRTQWLGRSGTGFASVVLIRGLKNSQQLDQLRQLANDVAGVQLVDRTREMSSLLAGLRDNMTWLLIAGHVLVWAALVSRYRGSAWRAWLPTALASLGSVAMLGYLGEPFQLFNLLALILMLGMGVDYGIFLLEHQGENQPHVWLGVLVGALSTAMSFGLLALSATPALHTFGLTLLMGLTLVCLFTPYMRLSRDK